MEKTNNTPIPRVVDRARILIYDDRNIVYYSGTYVTFEWNYENLEYYSVSDPYPVKHQVPMDVLIQGHVTNFECMDNVVLDATTMKRIAKYNKEAECLRLDKEIAEKKKEIENLDDILKDRKHRVAKLKKFICNIYDIDLYSDDDYDDD